MKKIGYAVVTPTGQIFRRGTLDGNISELGFLRGDAENRAVEIDLDMVSQDLYWDPAQSTVKVLPPRPSEHHEFNAATKTWAVNNDAAWAAVATRRLELFAKTEWVRSRATDQGQPVPQEWLDYWQALRDITEQPDPLAIDWPEAP